MLSNKMTETELYKIIEGTNETTCTIAKMFQIVLAVGVQLGLKTD
jgi:hypothetical protein